MKPELAVESGRAAQPRAMAVQWLGVLGPPLVWLTQFQIKYTLADRASSARGHVAIVLTGLLALAIVASIAVVSTRQWRTAASSPLDEAAGLTQRNRFMAMLGAMSSALFLLLILAQALADLFFEPGMK